MGAVDVLASGKWRVGTFAQLSHKTIVHSHIVNYKYRLFIFNSGNNQVRKCRNPLIDGADSARKADVSVAFFNHQVLSVRQVVAGNHFGAYLVGAMGKQFGHNANHFAAGIGCGLRHGVHESGIHSAVHQSVAMAANPAANGLCHFLVIVAKRFARRAINHYIHVFSLSFLGV